MVGPIAMALPGPGMALFVFLNIYTEIKLIMKAIMKELNDVNQLNDFGH